jgi:dihydroorotase
LFTLAMVLVTGLPPAVAAQATWPGQAKDAAKGVVQPADPGEVFDLVILGGRLVDPASGFDGLANLGVAGGIIRRISATALSGRQVIDATGLIVAPGFIDILSYDPTEVGTWNKISDGVTTVLAMHGGTSNPVAWYAHHEKQRHPVNFGGSFFQMEARNRLGIGRYAAATSQQIERLLVIAERALRQGALGVSFSPEYAPGTSSAEIVPLMSLARSYAAPVFFHARYSDMEEPGTNLDGLNEIVGYARETGAAVHIDHLNSTGGTFSMKQSLELLDQARSSGLDITACAYPYAFWATYLNSARFDPGWQSRFRISFGDLQVAGTADRLTEQSFKAQRRAGKLAVAYAIPEDDVVDALRSPMVMIGSDAILEPGFNNHPRASGTFARTLALYARDRKALSLMDAIAKMTIMPARRLERRSEAMTRKGRLAVGADADITILDYDRVADHATVEHPEYPSSGIAYVIVNGRIVKDPVRLRTETRPGRPIRGDPVLELAKPERVSRW